MSNPIDHTAFLAAEAEHWRDQARRLAALLDEIQDRMRSAALDVYRNTAPEPPVGTRYYASTQAGAVLVWERRDGWSCPSGTCDTCPTNWVEVAGFVQRRNYLRCLPGEIAPPLAGEVSVDHPEVPF